MAPFCKWGCRGEAVGFVGGLAVAGRAVFSRRAGRSFCARSERQLKRVGQAVPVLDSRFVPRFEAGERAMWRAVHEGSSSSLLSRAVTPIRSDHGCCLYGRDDGVYEARDTALVWLMYGLFTAAAEICACNISVYDLHHSHFFYNRRPDGVLGGGLLFHAREYPRIDSGWPHDLGFCQRGSDVIVDGECMLRRNVLYELGSDKMELLDPLPMQGFGMEGVHTVDEGIFGERLADIYLSGGLETFRIVPFR